MISSLFFRSEHAWHPLGLTAEILPDLENREMRNPLFMKDNDVHRMHHDENLSDVVGVKNGVNLCMSD